MTQEHIRLAESAARKKHSKRCGPYLSERAWDREYFEAGARDMAQAESEYPGWLPRLLTDPVDGLHNYEELYRKLTDSNGAIKVFCKVAEM